MCTHYAAMITAPIHMGTMSSDRYFVDYSFVCIPYVMWFMCQLVERIRAHKFIGKQTRTLNMCIIILNNVNNLHFIHGRRQIMNESNRFFIIRSDDYVASAHNRGPSYVPALRRHCSQSNTVHRWLIQTVTTEAALHGCKNDWMSWKRENISESGSFRNKINFFSQFSQIFHRSANKIFCINYLK